jgi:ABC-type transporter Mla subunit MlaD
MSDTALIDRPDATSADILAFPAGRARAPSPETRLARALASLQAALEEQRAAAHALQDASAALRTTMGALHDRLAGHRDTLGVLADQVGQVNSQARTLERWADGVLAKDAPPR